MQTEALRDFAASLKLDSKIFTVFRSMCFV